ncbi:Frag1/DRAM/Sfk1 family-domain-containing protein [Lipomyces arxii]|uniref:Frag1/DRAM/Sfk1 family-domain-containing protein n=1 Tax=Lipomyces arxii TaxID=56418 RepID=UPI0034CD8F09
MDEKSSSRIQILEKFRFYWLLPLASVLVWWSMLVALMGIWAGKGYRIYPDQNPSSHVPYISDIAASGIKPLFIACDAVQGVFFVLALMSERYLRHKGRLARNRYTAEKVLSGFAIVFAIAGQIGLLLLSILDTYRHHHQHIINVGIFVAGVGLAGFCSFVEFTLLRKKYYETRWLRFSYVLKGIWFFVALGLAIAFACLMHRDDDYAGAVVEWTLGYWYGFFSIVLVFDLLPASKKSQARERGQGYLFGMDSHTQPTPDAGPVRDSSSDATRYDGSVPQPAAVPLDKRDGMAAHSQF